jgi:DNA-binding transcriptional LysR family regulator
VPEAVPPFRLLVVPGANPAKWVRVWSERLPDVPLELVAVEVAEQEAALRDGRADAGLVRLPVDRDALSAIPLYTETSVVVVPREHLLTAADEVEAADLADETLLVPLDDVLGWVDPPGTPPLTGAPATTADAVELVAAGVGVVVVPQSLARLHHRRDVTFRPVTDAPTSSVGLAWVTDRHDDLVEEMIGIVRGRTANSSRGRSAGAGSSATPAAAGPDRPAKQPGRAAAPRPRGGAGGSSSGARGVSGGTRGGAPRKGGGPARRRRG